MRFLPDGRVEASAEFTDARRIAGERGIALSEAMALIESAARAALALEAHSDSNPGDSKPDPTHAKSPSHAHSHPNDHSTATRTGIPIPTASPAGIATNEIPLLGSPPIPACPANTGLSVGRSVRR